MRDAPDRDFTDKDLTDTLFVGAVGVVGALTGVSWLGAQLAALLAGGEACPLHSVMASPRW